MKASSRLRMPLCAACAGAFAGGVTLLVFGGDGMSDGARLGSANAAPAYAAPGPMPQIDPDFILCHTRPAVGTAASPRGMIRLAATQTEAPQARSNAASPALTFADTETWVGDRALLQMSKL